MLNSRLILIFINNKKYRWIYLKQYEIKKWDFLSKYNTFQVFLSFDQKQ